MKRPRLVLAALVLLVGAASAAGPRPASGFNPEGKSVMLILKQLGAKGGS